MKAITMIKLSVPSIILLIIISMNAVAGQKEDRLYDSILKATFTSEKSKIAAQLAGLGTKDAKEKLLQLLENSSSWNREAAVNGLFAFPDDNAGPALFDRMLSDHMIDSYIAEGFTSHIDTYYGFLINKYTALTDRKDRERIIEIISKSKSRKVDAFLKGIIENDN